MRSIIVFIFVHPIKTMANTVQTTAAWKKKQKQKHQERKKNYCFHKDTPGDDGWLDMATMIRCGCVHVIYACVQVNNFSYASINKIRLNSCWLVVLMGQTQPHVQHPYHPFPTTHYHWLNIHVLLLVIHRLVSLLHTHRAIYCALVNTRA